jgi:hypothetical protein
MVHEAVGATTGAIPLEIETSKLGRIILINCNDKAGDPSKVAISLTLLNEKG